MVHQNLDELNNELDNTELINEADCVDKINVPKWTVHLIVESFQYLQVVTCVSLEPRNHITVY